VYWIEAKQQQGGYPTPTPRAGYWRIETTLEQVDALWSIIKQATEAGQLGYKAKVSTSAARGQKDANDRVIHVCTYDSADSADVERVQLALRELGINLTAEAFIAR
jgi:hypothetical protein